MLLLLPAARLPACCFPVLLPRYGNHALPLLDDAIVFVCFALTLLLTMVFFVCSVDDEVPLEDS